MCSKCIVLCFLLLFDFSTFLIKCTKQACLLEIFQFTSDGEMSLYTTFSIGIVLRLHKCHSLSMSFLRRKSQSCVKDPFQSFLKVIKLTIYMLECQPENVIEPKSSLHNENISNFLKKQTTIDSSFVDK